MLECDAEQEKIRFSDVSFTVNNPIPANLKSEAKKAAKILREFTEISNRMGPDKLIPGNCGLYSHKDSSGKNICLLELIQLINPLLNLSKRQKKMAKKVPYLYLHLFMEHHKSTVRIIKESFLI